MKKLFILPVFALFVFASCKKSSSSPSSGTGSISATIDGKAETFNTDALAINSSSNGVYEIAIAGYQGAVGTSDQMGLAIAGTSAITAGSTYTFGTAAPDELSIGYLQSSGTIEYADDINSNTNVATVTKTSLTSTNIQGTFSGMLMLYSGTSSATTKTVTNGKFNVNFK